jgi:hypothetical protein
MKPGMERQRGLGRTPAIATLVISQAILLIWRGFDFAVTWLILGKGYRRNARLIEDHSAAK